MLTCWPVIATISAWYITQVRLARQSQRQRAASLQEMVLAARVRHPYVVGCREAWIERGCVVHLVTQYCDGGDLYSVLRRARGRYFAEEQILAWAAQLLMALRYLHGMGVVHRDVKSANVFLKRDGTARLGDLGLACVLPEGSCATAVVGTPNYMAPEVLSERPYGHASDIWSLGCVLYELAALRPAFSAFNMGGLVDKVKKGAVAALPAHFSAPMRALVRSMLRRRPQERPTAEALLQSALLAPVVERLEAQNAAAVAAGGGDALAPSLAASPVATPRSPGIGSNGAHPVQRLCDAIARGRTLNARELASLELAQIEAATRQAAAALSAPQRANSGVEDGAALSPRSRLARPRTANPRKTSADVREANGQRSGALTERKPRPKSARTAPRRALAGGGGRSTGAEGGDEDVMRDGPRLEVIGAWFEEQRRLHAAGEEATAAPALDGTAYWGVPYLATANAFDS